MPGSAVKFRRLVQAAMNLSNTRFGQFFTCDVLGDTFSVSSLIRPSDNARPLPGFEDFIHGKIHVREYPRLKDLFFNGITFVGSLKELCSGGIRPIGFLTYPYVALIPVRKGIRICGAIGLYADAPFSSVQVKGFNHMADLIETTMDLDSRRPQLSREQHMVSAEERFRRAVAEELHGPIQTKLFLIAHALQTLSSAEEGLSEEGREQLESALEDLEGVRHNEIRGLSHRIHPGIIRVALRPALRSLERRFEGIVDVRLVVGSVMEEMDTPIDNGLSERVRLTAYRVVEESILNAVRHGQAQSVDVNVDVANNSVLTVRIIDDGCGFSNSAAGMGIYLMKSRVRGVNGHLRVESTPDVGTQVEARIPIRAHYRTTAKLMREKMGITAGYVVE